MKGYIHDSLCFVPLFCSLFCLLVFLFFVLFANIQFTESAQHDEKCTDPLNRSEVMMEFDVREDH